ncbi:MAG: hypothetical protein A2653_00580 [Candidatus Zambryskibacteria bacterium RIFCSPHIGHO2_01_FULL_43_25]|uniref:HIT domain-containing protein n=1 Tax=Candidatus Zambryskibacteria bacterium RIFCSPLOWO2_01_FULL_45_21 TaxID=1802761 RepID=A0A1G2U672_9BACT|nr:MAG: hypothetical protein A2653_00580 [Candidatus Zambryskibacteria bacterium RIFCSPHIGHO2_01_FULL_43_25]OHB00808.1 MAG: hypothetical protein A3E94_00305 [Candidatus Zambryskibacteria bacterium RIFCSPHIGHO2_12_FULL_44_12b]OHB04402.1 MAG: hypothetical protein A3B14_03105 [Candidatus Zambryskibacteria bacterium RIFCSPLOWO2_01_FULL_45_21]
MDDKCVFCKIIKSEIPSHKVYEDGNTFAFLEIKPSAPGHLMVVHKRHGESVIDYSKKELGEIMTTVRKTSISLEKVLSCDSITIGINHLEKKGIRHLHIHLIPRWANDGGGIMQTIVNNPPKEKIGDLAQKIRKELM